MPSGRPSCERVSSAIREGRVRRFIPSPCYTKDSFSFLCVFCLQLDPIQEDAHRFNAKSSLVPMTRRTSSSDSRIVPSDDPPGEFELPVVISEEPDEFKDDTELSELSETPHKERMSLLELTAQREDERKRVFGGFMGIPMTTSLWIRTVKSSILVAKVSITIY